MSELVLNRYRPLAMIGSGGQADVLVAFDEQMKRRVAIKSVALADTHASAAAIEEARTAAMLTHPHIVTMYDFALTDDRAYAYLIMEHIDGLPLSDIASEDLTADIVASIARDVGEALVFAHKNGVLHLDIKPGNIIINHEGLAKVIDFGVSALSQKSGGSTARAGTVGYMPLEQISGEVVTAATDQWAYAAVIYELLTDEFPYEEELSAAARLRRAADDMTLMKRLQTADEPNLIQTHDHALNATLARALSREPTARYPQVKELRRELLDAFGKPSTGRKQLAEIIAARTDDSVGTDGQHRLPDPYDPRGLPRPHPLAGCFSAFVLGLLAVVLSFIVLK